MRHMHTINLSGAWEPPAAAGAPWTRRFGRPDGLSGNERVWLVIEQAAGVGAVRLNGLPLAAAEHAPGAAPAPRRWEITAALAPRNVLTLLLPAAAASASADGAAHGRLPLPSSCGRVRLEIEAADEGGAPRGC
jgi:hypothetical protein